MTTKVRANLSRYHPDYGLTMVEHLKRKADRLAGKLSFDPKNERRRKAEFKGRRSPR